MAITLEEGFWDFSNRVYRQPEVNDTCLALQNLYGLDVNLLLFACWHARTRGLFTRAMLTDALAFSSLWAVNVVQPLRNARNWMKTSGRAPETVPHDGQPNEDFELLRNKIKALELQSEQFQEDTLESLTRAPVQVLTAEFQIAATIYNLRYIIEASALPRTRDLGAALATLVMRTLCQPEDAEVREAIIEEFLTDL